MWSWSLKHAMPMNTASQFSAESKNRNPPLALFVDALGVLSKEACLHIKVQN